jgi:hypothetical protein
MPATGAFPANAGVKMKKKPALAALMEDTRMITAVYTDSPRRTSARVKTGKRRDEPGAEGAGNRDHVIADFT